MHDCVILLQLTVIALILGIRRSIKMNEAETAAFAHLSAKVDELNAAHEHLKSENASLVAENDALKAQIAAIPAPVDETAEVVAAVDAITAKVDAELAPPVAPAAS